MTVNSDGYMSSQCALNAMYIRGRPARLLWAALKGWSSVCRSWEIQ